jgi:hypothetical protein
MKAMRAGWPGPRTLGAALAALLVLLVGLSLLLLGGRVPSPLELLVLASTFLGLGLLLRWKGTSRLQTPGLILLGIVSLAILASLIAGSVYRLLGVPVRPDRTLVPEVVGVVVRWDFVEGECQTTRVTLQSGRTLDLRLLGDARAKCGDGPWATGVPELTSSMSLWFSQPGEAILNGGLLYYGHDGQAEWIGGASSNRPGADQTACPYTLWGSGYDEGDVLHLSTGLVVTKTVDFENKTPWMKETSTFRDSDDICVNQQGEAVSIRRFSPI